MKKYLYVLLAAFVAVFALSSCSEDDNTPEEYPDWQATNEKYFDDLFATAKMKQASGDPSWKVIRNLKYGVALTGRKIMQVEIIQLFFRQNTEI